MLWEDPHAAERVRWANASGESAGSHGIDWTEHTNSIDVKLTAWPDDNLILAFAANPGLHVCRGNSCRAIDDSPDGLIHVTVSPGERDLRIIYRNGLYVPSILIALLTAMFLIALKARTAVKRLRQPEMI